MAARDAILDVVRPRNTLGASAAVYVAAETLHLAHAGSLDVGLFSAAVTAGAGWKGGPKAAAAAGVTGGWLTLASAAGPWAGSWHPLTILWGAGAVATLITVNMHSAVKNARAWRKAKADWLNNAPRYGLFGSHLLHHEFTRLGERLRVDVTETGKRSSSLPHSGLAEDIASHKGLARSRVRVSEAPIAGQIDISIRTVDPWKHAIAHPLLDSDPEITLALPATIREPLVIGQDPETGRPLTLAVWDGDGGRNIFIIAKKGAGKSTLLSCIRERLTACPDALVFGINVSKAIEDLEWAPACHLTAIGPGQAKKALAILQLVRRIIDESGAIPRDDKVILPRPDWPAVVLVIDEIDALIDLLGGRAKALLKYITSKDRSESVSLIAAGQRGTADWMGGSDVRANLDVVCAGKVRRQGEINHAVGTMGPLIPDMATYGEGHPGVWAVVEDSGDYQLGRTFDLSELPDIRQIAWDRRDPAAELNPVLSGRIGDLYTTLRSMQLSEYHSGQAADTVMATLGDPSPGPALDGAEPVTPAESTATAVIDPASAEPGSALDRELEQMVTPEMREQMERIDGKLGGARKILNENPLPDMSDISPEQWEAFRKARWEAAGEQTEIPGEARAQLLGLLAGEGMSGRKITEAFPGVKRHKIMLWLNRLRYEGLAEIEGKGRAARWRLVPREGGGDGHE